MFTKIGFFVLFLFAICIVYIATNTIREGAENYNLLPISTKKKKDPSKPNNTTKSTKTPPPYNTNEPIEGPPYDPTKSQPPSKPTDLNPLPNYPITVSGSAPKHVSTIIGSISNKKPISIKTFSSSPTSTNSSNSSNSPVPIPASTSNTNVYNNSVVVQDKNTPILNNLVNSTNLNKYLETLNAYNVSLNSIIDSINKFTINVVAKTPEYNPLGSDYEISISDTIGSQVITLIVAQGPQGPQGNIGEEGLPGPQGPQGPQGPSGQQGPFIQ